MTNVTERLNSGRMVSQVRHMSDPNGDRPAPVRLLTLGTLSLNVHGADLPPGLASGKPLALLAYLALHNGRGATRDELADLLWEGRDLKEGRRVLRQALYLVRKGLGPTSLETTSDTVRVTEVLHTDVDDFETAIRSCDHQSAIDLYQGPFLQGFKLPHASRFSIWVDGERSRLHGMFNEAALTVADQASGSDDWDLALQVLDQLLSYEPEHLIARCRRIEAFEASGRTVEAAAAARELANWSEAEDEPLPEWARTAVARLTSVRGPTEPTDREDGLRSPAFSGRGAEYRVLLKQWQAVTSGEGRVALVVGDPGIGKTRLIEELLWVAEREGGRVLRGKSYQFEDGLLFGALVDVMAQATTSPGFAAVSDVWIGELARLLPELLNQYPELRVPASEEGDGRRRFHEAVAQVLDAIAYEAPVVCVLDDLHWADDATLELVHYLARRLCATRVLLVAGLRPGEASETLLRLQHVLETEHGGVTIALPPLSRESVSDILTSMAHDFRPPTSIEETLWEASAGNPFLTVSVLRALVGTGSVSVDPNGWKLGAPTSGSAEPRDADFLLRSLVAELPGRSLQLLELAAIVGRTFTAAQIAMASQEEPESARIRLDALETRRILKSERSGGVTRFDFIHDRMRQIVYESIPPDVLRDLHGRVARAAGGEVGLNACIQARRFHQAGERDEAYRHALTGAEWARSVFAHGGELEMLELALTNAPDAEARESLQARLNSVHRRTSGTVRGTSGRSRGGWWRSLRWPAAMAAVLVVAAFPPSRWSTLVENGRPPTTPVLPPLPPGIIIEVDGPDWSGFAVIDPAGPEREPQRLSGTVISRPDEATGRLFLSPDRRWMAFNVGAGDAPDVWLQQRDGQSKRRLTYHEQDDVVLDWAPDGASLLIGTRREQPRSDNGTDIAIAYPDGSPVRVLTGGPWDDGGGRFSPTGTRIALIRGFTANSIWIMDADGSDAYELIGGLGQVTRLAWSPDESRVAFSEQLNTGYGLFVLDLDSGDRRRLAEGVNSEFLWSEGGGEIYAAMIQDRNSEIVAISTDDGTQRRLTFSAADETPVAVSVEPPPFISGVEVITTAGLELALLEGDTLPVTAVIWLSDGSLAEGQVTSLRCVDSTVCEASNDGSVRGLRAGLTNLIADVGGWRADTVVVRVVSTTPELLLEEDWEGGIDSLTWTAYGDPRPEAVEGLGRNGSRGFVSNGDGSYSSGVVSRAPVDLRNGLTIEFWARGDFGTEWPSHQGFRVALAREGLTGPQGDISLPLSISVQVGRADRALPLQVNFGTVFLNESAEWSPRDWHHYALQVVPGGRCEFWIDSEKRLSRACNALPSDSTWVEIGGRASPAPVVHDNVKVWQGIKWR
jgi:DNA-binding SARP family transcriptional activator